MKKLISRKAWLAFPLVAVLALGACDDDPVGLEEEHAEPHGLVVSMSGQVLATYDMDAGWSEVLGVVEGAETPHLDVVFVDEAGDPIELEEDTYLEVVVSDGTVAAWEQDSPGEFGGHLVGVSAGQTTAVFQLMHGAVGSGHADFVTAEVTITVL